MQSKPILAMLMQQYDSFTRAEKKIADYVLSHKLESQYMTITELAERTGVAEATLTRFCRTLGCGGFGEFKLALAKDSTVALDTDETGGLFENIDPSDGVEELCQKLYHANREALNQTYQLVEPKKVSLAVDLIQQAQRVYCYGQGGSSIMAMEAWGRFVTVTNKVQWVQDSHMQAIAASLLDPGDVILFFSFSGATKDLMDVAHIAVQTGVRLILVTRFPSAPAAALADVVLLCGAVEGPLQMGSVSAKVAQLYLIDVLFNEFCRRDQAQTSKNRERTLDSIANKLL